MEIAVRVPEYCAQELFLLPCGRLYTRPIGIAGGTDATDGQVLVGRSAARLRLPGRKYRVSRMVPVVFVAVGSNVRRADYLCGCDCKGPRAQLSRDNRRFRGHVPQVTPAPPVRP